LPFKTVIQENRACRAKKNPFRETLQQQLDPSYMPPVDVGGRLRGLRLERGLSIRALAEQSDLNVNTLSLIENGKTSPSVATLQQLAFSLGVHITAFFENGGPQKKVAFHKAKSLPRVGFTHGYLENLSAGIAGRGGAEPFLVTLEPQAESGVSPIVHTGREFVFCLEGRLAYTIDAETYLLEPGDSLLFEAHLPHRWQNVGQGISRSLLVLCPTDENDRPTEQHFSPGQVSKPARSQPDKEV
jgi:quercetin dioxygenase-like cupin family protein